MATRIVDGIEVEVSSGNVFADLGFADADKLKVKSGLMIEIIKAVRRRNLTQEEAGRCMGIPQPKVSALLRGDFTNLSERKLMECLNKLGYDIEITVKPAASPVGLYACRRLIPAASSAACSAKPRDVNRYSSNRSE